MRNSLRSIALVACIALVSLPVSAQEADPSVTWQVLVNQARLEEGLAPYGFSSLLTAAAQRHADDLAAHQIWSHTGSDGSTSQQRIKEAGYAAWTWNSGQTITGESFWTGYGTIQDALTFFLEDAPHRENTLSPIYREIGVGVATDSVGRNYYVLDFGARPNVLPVFINDGAANTDNPQIAIRLTNENARPDGQGTGYMGKAIEVRISDTPNFDADAQPWQAWESLVAWTLPNTPGEYTVYVQFRDAAGRTAASADAVILGEGASIPPTPIPPGPTPLPTATPIPPSPTPTFTITPVPTAVPPPEPTATLMPEPSLTPLIPTPLLPTPSPLPPGVATPFPTWTPLPTAAPPVQPGRPSPLPAVLVVLLQGLAVFLGLVLALRRRRA